MKFILLCKPYEERKAFFLKHFGREVDRMLIIPFGKCNYRCPYCKRDGQFVDASGNCINAIEMDEVEMKSIIDAAISNHQKVRLSGGDPACFPEESLWIARYVYEKYEKKISIAHNGSSLNLVKILAPYLDYAAIDIKGSTNEDFAKKANISPKVEPLNKSIEVIAFLLENKILTDVRTCVFGDDSYSSFEKIATLLSQMKNKEFLFWTLRKYNEVGGCDFLPVEPDRIRAFAEKIAQEFQIPVGFRTKWRNSGFEIYKY